MQPLLILLLLLLLLLLVVVVELRRGGVSGEARDRRRRLLGAGAGELGSGELGGVGGERGRSLRFLFLLFEELGDLRRGLLRGPGEASQPGVVVVVVGCFRFVYRS